MKQLTSLLVLSALVINCTPVAVPEAGLESVVSADAGKPMADVGWTDDKPTDATVKDTVFVDASSSLRAGIDLGMVIDHPQDVLGTVKVPSALVPPSVQVVHPPAGANTTPKRRSSKGHPRARLRGATSAGKAPSDSSRESERAVARLRKGEGCRRGGPNSFTCGGLATRTSEATTRT